MEERLRWELVNPEGVVQREAGSINPHPETLEGKTVLLRWNGKHNGDIFLSRIGDLLRGKVRDLKVIKGWEVAAFTAQTSHNPEVSRKIARRLAQLKPDIVIGAQAD